MSFLSLMIVLFSSGTQCNMVVQCFLLLPVQFRLAWCFSMFIVAGSHEPLVFQACSGSAQSSLGLA